MYKLPADDVAALQSYCREELEGVPVASRSLSLVERRQLLGEHGEAAAKTAIRDHLAGAHVENVNDIRRNHPGYDLLINGRHRVQVKGRCWVELIDFAVSPLSKRASWDSDLWIAVDFGPMIDGRWGRLARDPDVAPRNEIDFYIAPTEEIRDLVRRKSGGDFKGRVKLWAGKTEKYRRNKHHTPELFGYRNAFQHIAALA